MKTTSVFMLLLIYQSTSPLRAQDIIQKVDSKPYPSALSLFKLSPEQSANKNRFLRYSALSGYREGVAPIKIPVNNNFKVQSDTEKGIQGIMMYNLSIPEMLTHGVYKSHRVILEVKDPSRFRYDPAYGSKEDWVRKNLYCYEFVMPIGTFDESSELMEQLYKELTGLFAVQCIVEKRSVKTLILVRTSSNQKFESKGEDRINDITTGRIKNWGIGTIGSVFYANDIMPFVDETGYKGLIDVSLGLNVKSMADIPALRKALQQYDLDIKEELRMMTMFVITENKQK